MGKLVFSAIMSLDGYIADRDGNFEWAAPDAQVHAFVNDLERSVGTYLYGRRMYETMVYWETPSADPDQHPVERDFTELWQRADKIVYSTTLQSVRSARTRIERRFDADAVRQLKSSVEHDITVGGPHLAAVAIRAALVDEYQLFITPAIVGGGTRALPEDVRFAVEMIDERRFDSGVVFLRYAAR